MGYREMRAFLLENFNKENTFTNALVEKKINEENFRVTNDYDLNLVCNFPGYKSKINGRNITYDYRIDYNGIPISHVNIIVDLFNKAQQYPEVAERLNQLLYELGQHGDTYDRNQFVELDDFPFASPSDELIQEVNAIHRRLGKQYQDRGNAWNYSLDELANMIMWIVIQEDINYPMPRYLGRRMSFYRYLEAIYVGANHDYSLFDVIAGALSHRSVRDRWAEVNYEPIKNLR